jgi:YidC/Oxa1 family membrane protein insertase
LFIIDWLATGVSWILVQFHAIFSAVGMDPASGWTWTFSIVGLVVVIRILLIPLFVKQIKAQRNMQIIQPRIKEIQKKYAGDREKQSQEMMKIYRETGTNPLSSCLPILLQAPIFFALFTVLQGIAMYNPDNPDYEAPGVFAWEQYAALLPQAHDASIFGAPLYGYFMGASEVAADGFNPLNTRILSFVLIILMTATTFITQRQLIVKNSAPDNPFVKQQKILLYVFPLVFAIGGINPQPGTPAFDAWEARKAEKAARKAVKKGDVAVVEVVEEAPAPVPRVQPKRQPKSKRSKGGSKPPDTSTKGTS